MKKTEKDMKNIKYELPHIGLVLVFSIICCIIKLFNCTAYDWIHVVLTIPICLYFLWTFGFVLLFVLISISVEKSNVCIQENERNGRKHDK